MLKEFNFKKKYGQNFLNDKRIIDSIVFKSGADESTLGIEVGPGAGALTKELAKVSNFDESRILRGNDLEQTMHGCGFLWTYFPHWVDVRCGNAPVTKDSTFALAVGSNRERAPTSSSTSSRRYGLVPEGSTDL